MAFDLHYLLYILLLYWYCYYEVIHNNCYSYMYIHVVRVHTLYHWYYIHQLTLV